MIPSRQLFRSLIFLSSLLPAAAMACAILPPDLDRERNRKIVEEFKDLTGKLKQDADLIFIGRITRLDYQHETDDKWPGQLYLAEFAVGEEIKGHYPAGQALEFTMHKNHVVIGLGCRFPYWQLPKENGVGESYLVYARDGNILRTNHIDMDEQSMPAYDEAAFVRDHP
jgi:hypothetical protein